MRRLALLIVLALSGCGGAPAADLFVVHRTGSDRNANLTLLVADDGFVTCNGRQHEIPGKTLLKARQLTRDMSKQAELNLTLPPGSNPVLRYSVRMEAGTVSFADTSRPLPKSFTELTVFTKDVSEDICGLKRD